MMKSETMIVCRARPVLCLAVAAAMALLASGSAAFAADDLCPDVQEEKHRDPGATVDVQASIEKLSLCVERARLLKQLDDIAKDRDDILTKVTAPVGMMGGVGGMPPLSSAILPPLPDERGAVPSRGGHVASVGTLGNPFEAAAQAVDSAVVKKPSWRVRKIWGQGTTMRAQLSDGSGTLLNVVKGDSMPDGRVVDAVSIKGVAVSQNGKVTDLPWDDMTPADAAR